MSPKGWIEVTRTNGGATACVQVSQIRCVLLERYDRAAIYLESGWPISVQETYDEVLALIGGRGQYMGDDR